MNSNESGGSMNFARFIRNRVSRFGRFGLSKKYKEVLMTPLSDEQRKTVIEKLRKKGLQPTKEWSKLKEENPSFKRPEELETKKVTFENKAAQDVLMEPSDRFIEDLLSSAPSSPTMSESQALNRPGLLNLRIEDTGQMSDVSQSAPSSPSVEATYYDTIPLLPECRNNSNEFFHPTNVPFKSFFPFQAIEPLSLLPPHLDDSFTYVISSNEPNQRLNESFYIRSSKVQSLPKLMEKLQISHLSPTFTSYGIGDLRAFTQITEQSLEIMKINSTEIRTKILTAIDLLSETEDSPEHPHHEDVKPLELPKRPESMSIVCQREVSDLGYISNTFVQKNVPQHVSRCYKYNKELKNQSSRKSTSLTPSRASSSQRKNQQVKKVGASNSRTRAFNPATMDFPHCKEPTIIHQHIHHHHHVGNPTFSAQTAVLPSVPQLDWNPRESTRSAVESKLLMESINLTEYPYSDMIGASGIPLRLAERYAYELDKDIRDVAIAMEIIRSDNLLERNRLVLSNMDAILSDQFLNCDGIKTDSLETFLISIGLPMYVSKIKQKKCRNLQTLLLYSNDALCRNFNINPSHVRWIRREASFFPTGFLSHISHHKQGQEPSQRFRSNSDAKFFALDKV